PTYHSGMAPIPMARQKPTSIRKDPPKPNDLAGRDATRSPHAGTKHVRSAALCAKSRNRRARHSPRQYWAADFDKRDAGCNHHRGDPAHRTSCRIDRALITVGSRMESLDHAGPGNHLKPEWFCRDGPL